MIRLALLVSLLGACSLYWGGGDDDTCHPTGLDVPAQLLRDPYNGTCISESTGPTCNPSCGPCPATNSPPSTVDLDWASCLGSCEQLAESACLESSSCHAAYTYTGNGQQTPTFWGCWDLPPNGAVTGGSCTGLDAQTCEAHTDCVSTYDGYLAPNTDSTFDHCAAEPPPPGNACDGMTCMSGDICVLQDITGGFVSECVSPSDAGTCGGATACAIVVPACPSGTIRGVLGACYSPYCIPAAECSMPACSTLTTEAACTARTDCDTIYDGMGCTCDHDGCTCTSETFDHCQ